MATSTLDAANLIDASRDQILDDVLIRLCNALQLSPTQFSLAESHYHSICDWLGAPESLLNAYDPDLYPQGSVALGTTVKPQTGEEYDVDLVCQLNIDYRSVPNPVLLLDMIEARMRKSEIYRDRLERKKRCLRVNYEHDFHLDILPACPDFEAGGTRLLIPDREDKNWQASNPKGFARWFQLKGALKLSTGMTQKVMDSAAPLPQPRTAEQKNTLQLSVQLIKRWRDLFYSEMLDSAPVSVVLTTLMGDNYFGEQSVSGNLAASVDAIVRSLPHSGRLTVINPSHPEEDLSERWDDAENYSVFVYGIKVFRKQIADLRASEDMGRQSALLQQMFGETLTKSAYADQAKLIHKFRDEQRMRFGRSAAGIISLSSSAPTQVPRNTFYGSPSQKNRP